MKLTQRILLLILITILLSILANFLLLQYQEQALHEDSEKILARTIIQSMRDALVQDVIDGNKLRVTNLLRRLKEHDNPIEFLYVTEGDQQNVFAHSFRQGFPRYLVSGDKQHAHLTGISQTGKYQTQQGLIYKYSEPLIAGLDTTLHIGINQSEIAEKLTANEQSLLALGMLITLLALLVAYFWSKQITSPLARFTELIRRFGAGEDVDFSKVEKNVPEIYLLATAFQAAIEERQQALMALRERERDLEITLNSIGDAVIATDASGNVTRLNPVAEQLTGWSLEEAKGLSVKTIFPIVDASTRETIENPIEKVLTTGETVYLSNHTTLLSKNGREYQVADSAAPIRSEDSGILGMVLVFNDVTEQYNLRQAVTISERGMAEAQRIARVGSWELDLVTDTLKWSDEIYRIFELDKENFATTYEAFLNVVHPDDREKVKAAYEESVKNKAPYDLVHRLRLADGGIKYVRERCKTFYDDAGTAIRSTGTVQDITEQVSLEESLRRTEKMDALGKLTGGIAHDYNNMLGVVLGYTELLENMVIDQPKLANYVRKIRHAGERGARLTEKLMTFSRQKITDAERLDINALLLTEQEMLEKTLTVRINLALDLATDLWPVWLDSSDLEDAIINLSINASHAIEGNGQLTIHTGNTSLDEETARKLQLKAGDYVLLSVTDTGCGMDESTREKIFEPFFSTKGSHGTGLGLSQVYGFVERSQGGIQVVSEPGRGTTITLYFPRHQETDNRERSQQQDSTMDFDGNETILIADDEQALLDLSCEIFEKHGYRTIPAKNAKQVLEILQQQEVDLLFCDIIMPDMNGYELAGIVREKYPEVRIQLASGFTDNHHVGMVDDELHKNLLYKPYQSQTLLKRVWQLLHQA